ncbi:MAG: transposase family protein [Candidatus Atribacteria bacterium]|nr:transposase family protein [Candidatus Atribacteria bacterium]
MEEQSSKMTRKMETAIVALLNQPTLTQAAETAGVGETTLWRWLQREDFGAAYREAKRQAVAQAIAHIQQISGEAVEVLREVMNNGIKETARTMAARTILELTLKTFEIENLEERLTRLEARLKS